jgi:hypothetical protein
MRKILIGFVLVAIAAGIAYLHHRRHQVKPALETVYAGNRQVTLWSTTAQVRATVATVSFGEKLDVLGRTGDEVQVRTSAGLTGWADNGDLLSSELWQKAQDLNTKAIGLPVEAHGHTRVISNMHLDPARDSTRIRQLAKGTAVEFYQRQATPVSGPSSVEQVSEPPSSDASSATAETNQPKKEDWWLVRAHPADQPLQTGWVLGRFIDLDIPEPLPDYATAAGMHITAYFDLNKVVDSDGSSHTQYLVVGSHGGENAACDFTMLRVFTWGNQRQRYETAFVDSDACGKLPVSLTVAASGDVRFSFQDFSATAPEERVYRMHQTIVRRVRDGEEPSASRKHRR